MESLNQAVVWLLLPLAVWSLLTGIDDLIIDLAALLAWLSCRRRAAVTPANLRAEPERPIAIFIPCWQESEVIARMIQQNTQAIDYRNYQVFIGAYPNDSRTVEVGGAIEGAFERVHLALCPHPGPTSKADCLNWIYQRMLQYENDRGIKFEIVVTHDAEDVIHAASLRSINFYSREYEMVQVPVLPIPTPLSHWTHAVYCDEFTEYQARDMPARCWMGGFMPSNGVGTGFRRDALERLANAESNRIFEPACLTEDYENGLRLKLLGAAQILIPLRLKGVATREYFPGSFAAAIRQRTRWVTGIALQSWERHRWTGPPMQKYWFWRDRKGLIGNPASLLTNAVFLFGVTTYIASRALHTGWDSSNAQLGWLLLQSTFLLGSWRLLYRGVCVGKHYGIHFALTLPLRTPHANLINSLATVQALYRFLRSKRDHVPLVWVKTEHQYPSQAALVQPVLRLREVLVGSGYISQEQLTDALNMDVPNLRLRASDRNG
ncbi:MAG: glycosyl transferase family protein [Bryobacteraceae bacterium]